MDFEKLKNQTVVHNTLGRSKVTGIRHKEKDPYVYLSIEGLEKECWIKPCIEKDIIRFEDEEIQAELEELYKPKKPEEPKKDPRIQSILDSILDTYVLGPRGKELNEKLASEEDKTYWNKALDYLKNERGVKYLVHFTPRHNLASILERGILPTENLNPDWDVKCPDLARYDNLVDFGSFTMSYYNYKYMFKVSNDIPEGFAVLYIDINVLRRFSKDSVLFFQGNAARSEFRKQKELFQGLDAIKSLFADTVKEGTEEKHRSPEISSEHTTNPQAEIMIKGRIPLEYIREIDVLADSSLNDIPEEFMHLVGKVDKFWPRCDYKNWQNKKEGN